MATEAVPVAGETAMNELVTVSNILRAVILYVLAWALVAVVPAFVWSKPPRKSARGRSGSSGPRKSGGRTLEGFLKLWLRIIVRGHKLMGRGLLITLAAVVAVVFLAALVPLTPVVVVVLIVGAALLGLLVWVVLPVVMIAGCIAVLGGVGFILYRWVLVAIAMVGAFVRWDLPTLASLMGPFLGLSFLILLPPSLYAAWTYRRNKIRRYEQLKHARHIARLRREELRRQALEPEPVEPVRRAARTAPPPPPRTIMEAARPELVAEARPAARRPNPKLVRRPIPKPEDRPQTVDWEPEAGA
jgi:hypothetical protein